MTPASSHPLHIFITGTGTGVGKTVVSAALAEGLGATRDVLYWKPVQTGDDDDAGWVAAHAAAPLKTAAPALRLPLPAAPDQAAADAGVPAPTVQTLAAALSALPSAAVTLVEGAGGILVPLNAEAETWVDFVAATKMPVLVAAAPGLGTLNHTALTVRHLQDRGAAVLGVVFSGAPHPANQRSLRALLPGVPQHTLGALPISRGDATRLATFVTERLASLAEAANPTPWLVDTAEHVWFPYTQHATAAPPLPIASAKGSWLVTAAGERLLDGVSSWWVNTVGHGRPEIARAIARQQQILDHVLFAGVVHEPAARLAGDLARRAGSPLSRVFFSDNGSTAVEVAVKIAYQAWVNRGEPQRTRFVSFRGSYHGDTFGAMSVAQAAGFHGAFKPLLFETLAADPVTTHPSSVCPEGPAALAERLAALDHLLAAQGNRIAGVVLEPLLQGAGGMLVQPVAFLQGVAAACKRRGVPLILDEVLTGLGRIGASFAFQRAGIQPDLVAIAKGLTGGNLPLAATLATGDLFQAFLGGKGAALLHGHSYTANPIACAAALATLAIVDAEDLPGRARALEARFAAWIADEGRALGVEHPRTLGAMLAFELPSSGAGDYFHPLATALPATARRHGLFLRPLGNTVYFLPPLAISDEDVEIALKALTFTVQDLRLSTSSSGARGRRLGRGR